MSLALTKRGLMDLRHVVYQESLYNYILDSINQRWNSIPDTMILCYVRFMRRRIIACIDRRGGHTRY